MRTDMLKEELKNLAEMLESINTDIKKAWQWLIKKFGL